jgi:UDP-N-acetyl-D-mannosaminuronic acid dehydrogenase
VTFSRVSVVGLGYIGLPTAAVIASRGIDVVGVDINPVTVDIINSGRIHIVEPELDIVVHSVVTTGRLRAVTCPEPADAFLVAVPTPFKDGHEPDLNYIEAAARAIAPVLQKGNVVVLESTSPVGATEQLCRWLQEARPDLVFPTFRGRPGDILVAHCPERVLPGHVLRELVENDRVIGGMTPACSEAAAALYRLFVQGQLVVTDARTAEMVKLTENAFRDVNIAFANELSLICDQVGIDAWELIRLANHHPRVKILRPGIGVGGHCIAVDPWFLVSMAPESAKLIRAAREVNDSRPLFVAERINRAIASHRATRVALLGLAFKPNVDDLRESPAVEIAQAVARTNPVVRFDLVEPFIDALPDNLAGLPNVRLGELKTAIEGADLVVGLVRHDVIAEVLAGAISPPRHFIDFVNFPGSTG